MLDKRQPLKTQPGRIHRLTAVLLILLLLALAAGGGAALFGFQAQAAANTALARQLVAQARAIELTQSSKQLTAVLLAIQSMRMLPSVEADQILHDQTLSRTLANVTQNDDIRSLAFSPDGKYVATAGVDQTARVWQAATGRQIALMAHQDTVNQVVFSPDGKTLLTAGRDKTARVWDALTGQELARVTHKSRVNCVAFSPDGRYAVSGSGDPDPWIGDAAVESSARVWETATGREVAHLDLPGGVLAVAFSPDGKYVVAGSAGGRAVVWVAATGVEVASIVPDATYHEKVNAVAFSPDGKYVLAGSGETLKGSNFNVEGNAAVVWEAATGREIARVTLGGAVTSVAFSPDGKYVISGGRDGTALVWEAATGRQISRVLHDAAVVAVAFSPDGTTALSAGADGTARVWQALTGKEIARMTHDDPLSAAAFSPDGKYVLSAAGHTARIWQAAAGTEIVHMAVGDNINALAFSPDGKYLATAAGGAAPYLNEAGPTSNDSAQLWETATGRQLFRLAYPRSVVSVAFSPDGKYGVSGAEDGTARVWQAATGREVARRTGGAYVDRVAFSPDGKTVLSATLGLWLAATGKPAVRLAGAPGVDATAFSADGKYVLGGAGDGATRVWDASTGRELARMSGNHWSGISSAAFSPDGKYVVSASADGNLVFVWQIDPTRIVSRMTLDRFVTSVAFSLDGKYVLSVGNNSYSDGTARLWEAATGREIWETSQAYNVYSAAFSPDGKYVLTGGADGTARLWETLTGREVARITPLGGLGLLAFSPDGRFVASTGGDQTVRIWPWQPQDLIADACARVSRNLTRAEWQTYIGDALPYRAVCPNLPLEQAYTPTPAPTVSPLVSAALPNRILPPARVWQIQQVGTYPKGSLREITYLPGARLILIRSSGAFSAYDIGYARYPDFAFIEPTGLDSTGLLSAITPDGKLTANAWDGRNVEVRAGRYASDPVLQLPWRSASRIEAMALSQDGSLLAIAETDGTLTVWDTALGKGHYMLPAGALSGALSPRLAFSPNGAILAAGAGDPSGQGSDTTLKLWNVASGKLLRSLNTHQGSLSGLLFSPDGATLAAGPDRQTVTFWNVSDGKLLETLDQAAGPRLAIAFAPDGTVLATGADRPNNRWDGSGGQLPGTLPEYKTGAWTVAFSPQGQGLASQSDDNALWLWHLAPPGDEILRIFLNRSYAVASLVCSPDGRVIVTAARDGTIRLWLVYP